MYRCIVGDGRCFVFHMQFGFLSDGYMNVVCENEVFKLHDIADEAVCVVLEDIKVMCAFSVVSVFGAQVDLYVSG